MDTGPKPFADFADLNHRGNTVADGIEVYGCHRRSQGYLNLQNPEPGKVYYWGNARRYEYHYQVDGWQIARGVRNAPMLTPPLGGTPLDGAIRTPGGSILLEMSEELAAEIRKEKQQRAMAHMHDDGSQSFVEKGYSIQERAAFYTNGKNPYFAVPQHGISYT